MEFLSDIELYYSLPENCGREIILIDDESKHAVKVMRHKLGDPLFVTNGIGEIFSSKIIQIEKDHVKLSVNKIYNYINEYANIYFCIPKLKSPERFEFALEKCVELGITNFLVFNSERTISNSLRIDRWNKIALSAMKQSLRSFLPKISFMDSIQEINLLSGQKFVFEQKAEKYFNVFHNNTQIKYYFLFGPEGGFTHKELSLFDKEEIYKLGENRLRSETAIIKCASYL